MKKLLTVVFTLLIAGSLAFAQATGGTNREGEGGKKEATSGKKATKTKKGHTAKKSKKGTSTATTSGLPPKQPPK